RKAGYTSTILGRRRYLPDLTSDNRQRREGAERMALDAPSQGAGAGGREGGHAGRREAPSEGSAAGVIKMAMLKIDASLTEAKLASRMLLQVHDELVLEIAPGDRAAGEDVVGRDM